MPALRAARRHAGSAPRVRAGAKPDLRAQALGTPPRRLHPPVTRHLSIPGPCELRAGGPPRATGGIYGAPAALDQRKSWPSLRVRAADCNRAATPGSNRRAPARSLRNRHFPAPAATEARAVAYPVDGSPARWSRRLRERQEPAPRCPSQSGAIHERPSDFSLQRSTSSAAFRKLQVALSLR